MGRSNREPNEQTERFASASTASCIALVTDQLEGERLAISASQIRVPAHFSAIAQKEENHRVVLFANPEPPTFTSWRYAQTGACSRRSAVLSRLPALIRDWAGKSS